MDFSDADDYDEVVNEAQEYSQEQSYDSISQNIHMINPEVDLRRTSILSNSVSDILNKDQPSNLESSILPLIINNQQVTPQIKKAESNEQISPLGQKLAELAARFDQTQKVQYQSPKLIQYNISQISEFGNSPIQFISSPLIKKIDAQTSPILKKCQEEAIQIDLQQQECQQQENIPIEIQKLQNNQETLQTYSNIGSPILQTYNNQPEIKLEKQRYELTVQDIPTLQLNTLSYPFFKISNKIKYPEEQPLLEQKYIQINYAEFVRSCQNDLQKWNFDFNVNYRVEKGEIIPCATSSDFVNTNNMIRTIQSGLPSGIGKIIIK